MSSSLLPSEQSVDVLLHGAAYSLTVGVTGSPGSGADGSGGDEQLTVDLEDLATGSSWHGEFSAAYVENVTSKTGSFKRFAVLVKMLQGALLQQTDSVFLDLLTYADLVRRVVVVMRRRQG